MKTLIFAMSALLLISCSKTEKTTEEQPGGIAEGLSNVQNLNKLSNSMDGITKNIEALKKLTPLSNDELKPLLPEQLLGLKRTELSVGDNAMMNMSSAESSYNNEDSSKKLNLQIMDGAGETGSSVVSMLMMSLNMDREKITENGFEKSKEIKGMKAMISENKNGEITNSEIQMIANNRYLVTLKGDGIPAEELEKAVGELNFSNFK